MKISSVTEIMTCLAVAAALSEGVFEVTFTKANGEERVMICTLHPCLLPEIGDNDAPPYEAAGMNDQVRCFDLEKKAWRSFNVSSVTKFQLIDDLSEDEEEADGA